MRIKPGFAFKAGIYFARNYFLRMLSGAVGRKLYLPPNLIDIKLTLKCNVQCRQCPVWQIDSGRELDTAQWKAILADIRKTVGPCFIRFYGGEPFCRDDFMELIRYANDIGVVVLITTNGTLITKDIADSLKQRDIGLINISLDGINAQTHNALRGKQVFEKAVNAIYYLKDHIPVQINTTVMEENLDELTALADFAKKSNLQISYQGLVNVQQDPDNAKEYVMLHKQSAFFPQDKQKVNRVFDQLIRQKPFNPAIVNSPRQLDDLRRYYLRQEKHSTRGCGALLNNHLIIKEKGDVYICSLFEPIGDLTSQDLKSIWFSEHAQTITGKMGRCAIRQCLAMRGYNRESIADNFFKFKKCLLDNIKGTANENKVDKSADSVLAHEA